MLKFSSTYCQWISQPYIAALRRDNSNSELPLSKFEFQYLRGLGRNSLLFNIELFNFRVKEII